MLHHTLTASYSSGKFLKHRHDVTSLGIAVLINLTEHNAENRAALPLATVQYNRAAQPHKASADSAAGAAAGGAGAVDVGDEDRISLLIVLVSGQHSVRVASFCCEIVLAPVVPVY